MAERPGTAPVSFPGGHDGFPGGEYGGMGEPDAFAATLRKQLGSHVTIGTQHVTEAEL